MILNSQTEKMCDQYQVPRKGTKTEKAVSNFSSIYNTFLTQITSTSEAYSAKGTLMDFSSINSFELM